MDDAVGIGRRLALLELVDCVHAADDLADHRVLAVEERASANMMKNWLLAELGLLARAMPTVPRLNGTLENSALRSGYFEPPVPLPYLPSPVCAMKPSMTRWNGTLS